MEISPWNISKALSNTIVESFPCESAPSLGPRQRYYFHRSEEEEENKEEKMAQLKNKEKIYLKMLM